MYSRKTPPLAISHRGLHTAHPENSIPAFLAAIDAGADGIELDIHASGDGVLFVHHDPVIAVNGDSIPIATLDSARIAAMTLPGGVAIPSLDDTLTAIGGRCDVFIEVKAAGIEEAVSRCLRRHAPYMERYAVHAFDHRIVRTLLAMIPAAGTGILQVSYLVDSRAAMRSAGASDLWQQADYIDARLVTDVHAAGGRVIAWTPNSPSRWETLAAMGVDGICTDRVDLFAGWKHAHPA